MPVTSSRRVGPLGRAPHSCLHEAASPWNGALLRGIFQPESHFSPFHLEQGRDPRDPSIPHRPPLGQRGARLQVSRRLYGSWAQRSGSPLSLDPSNTSPHPRPCLPVLVVPTQKHTTKNTSIGIAPEGPRQTGRAEDRKQMRLDPETRRARSRQTC